MHRMVRVATVGVVGAVLAMATAPEVTAGQPSDERVDVAVFELTGPDLDDELLETLSGVLRQEAQQHDEYSLANPAAVQRDEIALVVGCDADEVSCLRQMGDYVDGQVLIFGDVEREGDKLHVMVEIFDVATGEQPVRVERTVADIDDPVVGFRREVEAVFADLATIGKTHLVVDAPREEMPIFVDGQQVDEGFFDRQGLDAGFYRVAIGELDDPIWDDEVELIPGQRVNIRPEIDEEVGADDEVVADADSEMEVEETTVIPGQREGSSGPIEYEPRRSNIGAYSLMGMGVASLGASGIMVMQMRRVEDQIATEHEQGTLDEDRHRELERRGETYQAAQYVLLTVGTAGLAVGASWAIWNVRRDRREERALDARLTVQPTLGGMSISGRW